MEEAWGAYVKEGVPSWDAPASFWLWHRATQTNDYAAILRAPLTKENWLAARWLFSYPGFQQRYTALTYQLLRGVLARESYGV